MTMPFDDLDDDDTDATGCIAFLIVLLIEVAVLLFAWWLLR